MGVIAIKVLSANSCINAINAANSGTVREIVELRKLILQIVITNLGLKN